jgi:hypothetical protein
VLGLLSMTPIRDITEDLKARLELLAQRKNDEVRRHANALDEIAQEAEKVENMLELESQFLAGERQKLAAVTASKPLRPGAQNRFESEILDVLSNNKDWEHSEIKAELLGRGLGDANDPNFGRSLQGALLSMRARELVELVSERQWRITAKGLGPQIVRRRI